MESSCLHLTGLELQLAFLGPVVLIESHNRSLLNGRFSVLEIFSCRSYVSLSAAAPM